MPYQQFDPTGWERSLETTLANHTRKVEDTTFRSYVIAAMVKDRGNLLMNSTGAGLTRPVKMDLHDVRDTLGEDAYSPQRKNLWRTATHEMRGHDTNDVIKTKELLTANGKEAIIKVFDDMTENLTDSIEKYLATRYVVDGSLAANAKGWEGLATLYQTDGQTLNVSTGAARSANAADLVGNPVGTYAGLVMDLGNYGGEQASGAVWPDGQASVKYDFWAPLLVNATSTAFTGSTWSANAVEAMRFALIHSQRNDSRNSAGIDIFLMARNWLFEFMNTLDSKERVLVSDGSLPARSLGFKTLSFDNVELISDTSMPASSVFGASISNITLESMRSTLLHPQGPKLNHQDKSYFASVETNSNLMYRSPAAFCKISAIA